MINAQCFALAMITDIAINSENSFFSSSLLLPLLYEDKVNIYSVYIYQNYPLLIKII